jgi:hypothetical protein
VLAKKSPATGRGLTAETERRARFSYDDLPAIELSKIYFSVANVRGSPSR